MSQDKIGIKDMPETMRPREKMINRGESSLNDYELLGIVLGSGNRHENAIDLARRLLSQHDNKLRFLMEASLEELMQEKGIGPAKAVSIKAAIELGRRIVSSVEVKKTIKSPDDVVEAVKEIASQEMRFFDREHFRVMYLDRKGGLLAFEEISVGGLSSSSAHPREVFKSAVRRSAASIILIHNHPSGDESPSPEDIELTRRMIEAGRIIGIEVLDHVIIGEEKQCSLKARGLI